jgi:GMP synthase (glutamine-hydrolysing)
VSISRQPLIDLMDRGCIGQISEICEGDEPHRRIVISPVPGLNGDPVLGHLTGPTGVFSWHVDIFDLPRGATQLATGAFTEQQAFRYGSAWGLQFHPEVDAELFDTWLAAHPSLEMDVAEADRLRAEVRAGSAASASFISRLFDGFLGQVAA